MSDTELKPCRDAFAAWYWETGYYNDTVSTRKDLMRKAWQAAWQASRTAAKAPSEGDELSDEQQLGCLAEDLLLCISDHAYNSETPLRTKICFLIRPYLHTTTPAPDGPEGLVSKLEALKVPLEGSIVHGVQNEAINDCITLVKQHFGGKP